ncbi:MAG TPA: SGNH/GDSL hydrolase family protein [Arenibacter sp.]|nr:SGNH/GDSL hydrolase family protein [Arenibacter sp.]
MGGIQFFGSLTIFYLMFGNLSAQDNNKLTWWNPAKSDIAVVAGQAWYDELPGTYARLPKRAKKLVHAPLWKLSRNAAGLSLRFWSDASSITVRYTVKGNISMPHMPATGVSGVDLYAKTSDGEWSWYRGNFAFGDTIQYKYSNIDAKDRYHDQGREYQLYLPLYNEVEWLEIGIPDSAYLEPIPIRKERPVVIYGTSIAQGACASRPGMAWTSILERKLDRPLINLGFSGNGKLEKEVIDLITEIDAKVYVLDCLPNLWANNDRSLEDVAKLIRDGIYQIRQERPHTPILLVEHAGYSDGPVDTNRYNAYIDLNRVAEEIFLELQAEGVLNLYLLSKEELNLSMEGFVDGTHPTDMGMMEYALSYEKRIREIIKEPIGIFSTTYPVTQAREPAMYVWEQRHQELLQLNQEEAPKIGVVGNSIVHYWGGTPVGPHANGAASWETNFGNLKVRNFGFGWDRIENALWRVYHDELDGISLDQVVLMIGTNNEHLNTDEEIVGGLEHLIKAVRQRQPKARILMIGLLPRVGKETRISKLNGQIKDMASFVNVDYADIGRVLLGKDQKIEATLFSDGLHPNSKGYSVLGKALREALHIDTKE